jgi:hypothetical protein
MCASGTAVAHAATPPVLSDHVKFTGKAVPGSTQGSYDFRSDKCKLTSDGETKPFNCELSGHVTIDPATGAITGDAVVQSGDGKTTFNFTLTSTATAGTYRLKGRGIENDTPDPGQPPASYPCTVRGQVVATPQPDGSILLSGGFNVSEKNTAP